MKIAAIQAAPIFLDSQATTEKALTLMSERAYQDPAGHYGRPNVFSLHVNRDRQVPFRNVYSDPLPEERSVDVEPDNSVNRTR